MTTLTIINPDSTVIVDGEALAFSYTLDSNIHAIQWDGTSGEIEYVDGTPHATITSIAPYQAIVDGHATEKASIAAAEAVEAAAIAAQVALQDYTSANGSTVFTSDTPPMYGVVPGDTWWDASDELLSIASLANGTIIWKGV